MKTSSQRGRTGSGSVDKLRKQVRGNPDLELVLERIEQVNAMLEGLAEVEAATQHTERAMARAKVAWARDKLQGAARSAGGTAKEDTRWKPRSERLQGRSGRR